MLIETRLGPSKATTRGAPRTRLLSKIQSALGTLRPVIRWTRKVIGPSNLHSATRKATQKLTQLGVIPLQVRQDWDTGCRRMHKIGKLVREDLCLQVLVHLSPDPTALVPRPLPTLVDIMSLHDSLQQLGRPYARQQERERLCKWRDKMGDAWLVRPKEVYKWIKNEFQPPLVMLKDPRTREPASTVQRMDEILQESWDKFLRKYADTPEPDPDKFVQQYSHFIAKKAKMA